jgi:hypothetical protein
VTKYEKNITLSLKGSDGKLFSAKIGVSDAPSFKECDKVIIEHLKELNIEIDNSIRRAIIWNGKK